MKPYIPHVVFFSSIFMMLLFTASHDHTDFWFFDYQWDYEWTTSGVMTALVYPLCKFCSYLSDKITKRK